MKFQVLHFRKETFPSNSISIWLAVNDISEYRHVNGQNGIVNIDNEQIGPIHIKGLWHDESGGYGISVDDDHYLSMQLLKLNKAIGEGQHIYLVLNEKPDKKH